MEDVEEGHRANYVGRWVKEREYFECVTLCLEDATGGSMERITRLDNMKNMLSERGRV